MMDREHMISVITEWVPGAKAEEGTEWTTLSIPKESWPELAKRLRDEADWQMDFLFCLTCIDWKTHLTMVYHLTSTRHRHILVIKADLPVDDAVIHTASHLWKTAIFHEREVFEMFGVRFSKHPDLRLLILPEGWEGRNPMKKDFEDPVNMIRL